MMGIDHKREKSNKRRKKWIGKEEQRGEEEQKGKVRADKPEWYGRSFLLHSQNVGVTVNGRYRECGGGQAELERKATHSGEANSI